MLLFLTAKRTSSMNWTLENPGEAEESDSFDAADDTTKGDVVDDAADDLLSVARR